MRILLAILFVAALGMIYVRLAPSDPARWHTEVREAPAGDYTGAKWFNAVREDKTTEDLERLIAITLATPRTRLLAGSVAEGRLTFVTRSRLMGYPDYTTVQLKDGVLSVFGRSRFGSGDLGVNKARIKAWLDAANL